MKDLLGTLQSCVANRDLGGGRDGTLSPRNDVVMCGRQGVWLGSERLQVL